MATTDKNTIYSWFQTDDFPTEEQFRATWDSFWHKSESIPMGQIQGLNQMFVNTATVAQLNAKADVDHTHPDLEDYINDLQSGLDSQVIVNENQDELLQTLESSLNALNLWKSQMTSADADNLVNTLSELLAVFQSVPEGTDIYGLLAAKVNVSDIVNNLTSVDTTKVLSANQGKLLKDLIDSLSSALSGKMNVPTMTDTFLPKKVTETGVTKFVDSKVKEVTDGIDVNGVVKSNGKDLALKEELPTYVGGRNYLKNSEKLSGLLYWNTLDGVTYVNKSDSAELTFPDNGLTNGFWTLVDLIGYSGSITISFDIKVISGSGNFYYGLDSLVIDENYEPTNTDWVRHTVTLNIYSPISTLKSFVFYKSGGSAVIEFKNFKLEKGNIATDWTPNPDDELNISANSYSTNEIKTGGTWIDGKPIYRKVIELDKYSTRDISPLIPGFEKIIKSDFTTYIDGNEYRGNILSGSLMAGYIEYTNTTEFTFRRWVDNTIILTDDIEFELFEKIQIIVEYTITIV